MKSDAIKIRSAPAQRGPLLPGIGADGIVLTVTKVVPAIPGQPFTVAITEYMPVAAVVTLVIVGFCKKEEKLFGPVQVYVAPSTLEAVKFTTLP